jgi:hypothetical protein
MSLHPDYPTIEGRYPLTSDWELDLPQKFNRRIEDGNMVLWRPGLTLRISVWEPLPEVTRNERSRGYSKTLLPTARTRRSIALAESFD